MSRQDIVEELHRPARRNFKRRNFITKGINDFWQIDLVEMIPYSHQNKGFKYILTIIDTFSKFAYAQPIKNKTAISVTKAMEKVLEESKETPNLIQSDNGREFFNNYFQNLMNNYNIKHYSTFTHMKAAICERFNRTLKNKMWKMFTKQGNYKWLENLQKLIHEYNNTKHSKIKMKPSEVNKKNEKKILNTVYKKIKLINKNMFKIGDFVRVSKMKNIFQKGYTPNWSTEIFKISKINLYNPLTYVLEDYQGNRIKGGFYGEELQLAKHPNVYLVEKILRKKGDKVLVKWLNFDKTHNSWINKKDVI